jgi:hypothetical protein
MQNYDPPKGRNTSKAASGMLPNKVSVPLPGVGDGGKGMSSCNTGTGSKAGKAPAGFSGSLIPGKI